MTVDKSAGDAPISRHLEIERKFDVTYSTPTPSFVGQGKIARVVRKPTVILRATYFDTPQHDLAANRITLRRRTGGSDAGWHLKLPGTASTRTEVQAGLGEGGSDEVPAALRELVIAIVRDKPLTMVARITNHRTVDVLYGSDGAALAEFCDDQVAGFAVPEGTEQRWREWEIELVEHAGHRGAGEQLLEELSAVLHDSGAAPAANVSKLARVLAGPR